MMVKRAAIYARVSTEEQAKGFSLESQVEQLNTYLERKGYSHIEVFIDDGYSGKDFNRPNMQRLLRNLHNIDAIAVWKVDRLSRNNEQVLNLINNYLKPYDKKLLISTCDIDSSTSNGYMFISLLGTFAEYERTQIIERVNSGMDKRAKNGKWNGGIILGYDSIDGRLVVNEREKQIVQEIFELRSTGNGYKSIVNHLNIKGYKTKKGNPFGINSVKTILENPTYAGFIRWGKHKDWSQKRRRGKQAEVNLVKGDHISIINQELWEIVQAVGESRKMLKTTSNFEGEFILSGILKCPKCGKGMVMSKTKKPKTNEYYLYYQCQNFHQRGLAGCNSNLISKEKIEQNVIQKVMGLLSTPDIIEGVYERLCAENNDSIQEYQVELKSLKMEYSKKKGQEQILITKGLEALENQDEEAQISNNTLLSHVVKQKGEIERKINEYDVYIKNHSTDLNVDKASIINALENFNDVFAFADTKTKKILMKSLIKRIEVDKDRRGIKEMVLWFEEDNKAPLSPSIISEDIFPVNEARRTVP